MVKISLSNVRGYERILGYHKKALFAMDSLRCGQAVIVTSTAMWSS